MPALVARAEAFDDALMAWTEMTTARVVNRPSAMASNQSKPHQLALIHEQGFLVPETLVTTDVAALDAFREKHEHVIYKSISGVRSIVTRLTLEHRRRMAALAHSPVQFQQWVAGVDVQVHVAGDEVLACEIGSGAVDYRYPRGDEEFPQIVRHELPEDVAERCPGRSRRRLDCCWPGSTCGGQPRAIGIASKWTPRQRSRSMRKRRGWTLVRRWRASSTATSLTDDAPFKPIRTLCALESSRVSAATFNRGDFQGQDRFAQSRPCRIPSNSARVPRWR